MFKAWVRIRPVLLGITATALVCALNGCVESSFVLADDSEVPRFLTIPAGLSRADVSVTLSLYAPLHGRDAKVVMKGAKGVVLEEVKGHLHKLMQPSECEIVSDTGVTTKIRLRPYVQHQSMEINGHPAALFYVLDEKMSSAMKPTM